ncbi:hypothetical protein Ancab_026190 [Ancistrocladus abbreviatus]
MESPEYAPVLVHSDASRPSLGFPLGIALLMIVIFTLSGVFSCCYHWEKLRSIRRSSGDGRSTDTDIEGSGASKPPSHSNLNEGLGQSLPVLMPGDDMPRFIAMPCPREPPRLETLVVESLQKPPKLPRFPVPLY